MRIDEGEITEGEEVLASVDAAWRHGATQGTPAPHGATPRCGRCRSQRHPGRLLNRPGYLRFDFHANGPLSEAQRSEIEEISNAAGGGRLSGPHLRDGLAEAKAMGALALFGENYGDEVRVVDIGGPFSMELCGGTHVSSSAQIGPITVIGESSVGSACGASRRTWVWTPSGTCPGRCCAARGFGVDAEGAFAEVPGRVRRHWWPGCVTRRGNLSDPRRSRPQRHVGLIDAAVTSGSTLVVGGRLPDGIDAGDLRSLATDLRGKGRQARRGRAVLGHRYQGAVRRRHHRQRSRGRNQGR